MSVAFSFKVLKIVFAFREVFFFFLNGNKFLKVNLNVKTKYLTENFANRSEVFSVAFVKTNFFSTESDY